MAPIWIQATIFSLFMLYYGTDAMSCSTPFQAVFAAVTVKQVPTFVPDPNYTYYRETLRFTNARVKQEKEKALLYFKTRNMASTFLMQYPMNLDILLEMCTFNLMNFQLTLQQ